MYEVSAQHNTTNHLTSATKARRNVQNSCYTASPATQGPIHYRQSLLQQGPCKVYNKNSKRESETANWIQRLRPPLLSWHE